jgi:hypothetical protein
MRSPTEKRIESCSTITRMNRSKPRFKIGL